MNLRIPEDTWVPMHNSVNVCYSVVVINTEGLIHFVKEPGFNSLKDAVDRASRHDCETRIIKQTTTYTEEVIV